MKKTAIYTFLIFLLAGCNDPLDEFIYSSGAQLCGHYFILGDTIDVKKSNDFTLYADKKDTFSVYCDELGIYVLGSGTSTKQLLAIDKLTVSVNTDQRIDSLAGHWRTLTVLGRNTLNSLQTSPDSAMYADSIQYYMKSLKMANGYEQLIFNIQSEFSKPHFESPTGWSTEKASILLFEYEQVNEEENHYVISTMVEEF